MSHLPLEPQHLTSCLARRSHFINRKDGTEEEGQADTKVCVLNPEGAAHMLQKPGSLHNGVARTGPGGWGGLCQAWVCTPCLNGVALLSCGQFLPSGNASSLLPDLLTLRGALKILTFMLNLPLFKSWERSQIHLSLGHPAGPESSLTKTSWDHSHVKRTWTQPQQAPVYLYWVIFKHQKERMDE